MAELVKNFGATALGLYDVDSSYKVAGAIGGQVALDPDMTSKQVIDVLKAAGEVSVVTGNAPTNTTSPALSGTATVSETLSTNNGTWANIPTGYTYQWYQHTAETGTGTPIAGEDENTLQLHEALEDKYVYVVVTASNAFGSASAESDRKGPVVEA